MIEIGRNSLVFSFPEVHPEAKCSIIFQRTLRIPDGEGKYPVPPGLGRIELSRVGDYEGRVPPECEDRGGVFYPMFQAEASWIIFVGWYPFVVKVAVGGVNAVTGRPLLDERLWRPQDYVVVPRKPWMEWFCVGDESVRQFVALPLEEGLARGGGVPAHDGGIQITAHPMRAERYREYRRRRAEMMSIGAVMESMREETGPTPGWMLHSEAWKEDFGLGAWELTSGDSSCAYPLNSLDYLSITGRRPPGKPPTMSEYSEAGLPWYDRYDTDRKALEMAGVC